MRRLLLAIPVLSVLAGCETALVVEPPEVGVDDVVGDAEALGVAPGTVRVVDGAGRLPHARVTIRGRDGAMRRITRADGDGVISSVRADELVVATAAGRRPAGRTGPGLLILPPPDAAEQLVARRAEDGRVVAEVVAGDPAVPQAGALAPIDGASPPAAPFSDLVDHPLRDHIVALWSRGVVAGDPDGRFRPDDTLTRAEVAALLLALVGVPSTPGVTGFTDVDAEAWFGAPVATVARLGLMRGDPDGGFRPRDPVSRAELAAMLLTMGDFDDLDREAARAIFRAPDLARGHWARDAVAITQAFCRPLDPSADGALRPDEPATRAEAAAALSRFLACETDRRPTAGTLLAGTAATSTWERQQRHLTLRRERGVGTHYGDVSAFHALPAPARQAFVDAALHPGSAPVPASSLIRSSCVEYVMEQVEDAHDAMGLRHRWAVVDKTTRDDALKGTTLAAALVAQGWRAILVVASTDPAIVGDDREHAFALATARRTRTSYDVPLAGTFVDWLDDEQRQQALDGLAFGVLVQRGGLHVVAVASGTIHELARGEGPDQQVIYSDPWRDIVDVYAREVYGGGDDGVAKALHMWGSGIAVIPPGTTLAGVDWF